MSFWKLVADLGLPIAATAGMGIFILFIIKYILNGIVGSIKFIESVITQLDNRVKTMNNDILKIDQEVSEQLGIPNHNGLGMLLYQGCESFTFWTGMEAPVEVMRQALVSQLN